MNELARILGLPPEDRTQADLDYLIEHDKELNADQRKQLDDETKELSDTIEEEFEAPFVSKSARQINTPEPMVKNIGKKIVRNFTADVKDLGDGMMEAVISSETEDRHGEVVDMKGLDVKEYMKNPIISYLHQHDVPSIGRTHKLSKTKDKRLIAKFEWAIKNDLKQIHDKARLMYELYKEKFQFAFSIEFIPREIDGNRYTKSEMVGFAPVVVPANPDALLLAKKKGLDKEYQKTYNINNDMNELEKILAKIEKDGKDALTLADIKYLKANKEDLTGKQLKSLSDILAEKADDPQDPPTNPSGGDEDDTVSKKAVDELKEELKTVQNELKGIKDADPVKLKNINGQGDPEKKNFNTEVGYKEFGNTRVSKYFLDEKGEPTKEIKFLHYVKGVQSKDFSSYLDIVGKDAMNTTDDSFLVPPAEFLTEIERLEEEVGVAARYATVRRSRSGAGIRYVLGDDDLEIFDTAEGGVKKSTKLTYKQKLLAWRKFAGILPITDELTEDSAIDLWNDATKRFARAYAKRADQLVFTEVAAGGNTKNGILNETGVNLVTVTGGDSVNDIGYDDFVNMIFGVPTASAQNGRFYIHRTLLGAAMKIKDDEGRPLWLPSPREGAPSTILGYPYTLVDDLPGVNDDDAELRFAVFGDLRYVTLGERTDVQIKIFDTGSVGDPDDEDQSTQINLLTQDVQAMRAVKRMNAIVRFPEAFSVLVTGANS